MSTERDNDELTNISSDHTSYGYTGPYNSAHCVTSYQEQCVTEYEELCDARHQADCANTIGMDTGEREYKM